MNNFAWEQNWTTTCHLPSRRWKTRRIRSASDKKIISLYNELCSLHQEIAHMEFVELENPIQRGYKRHFELSELIRLGKEADFFQKIVNKINVIQYSNTKEFKKIRAKRLGRYKYRKKGNPTLLDLTAKQYKELTEREKLYFYPIETYYPQTKLWVTRYRFAEPWLFELRIRPNLVTRVQRRNWEAEYRCDEIRAFLVKKKHFTQTEKTRKAYRWWLKDEWNHRPSQDNPLRNKSLHTLIDEYIEEKQKWKYD